MNEVRVDFGKYSIPAEVRAQITEELGTMPRSVIRGLSAISSILFSGNEEENATIIADLRHTLQIARAMAQDYYEHKNGEIPEDVVTVIAGGPELVQEPEHAKILSAGARDLLDEVSAIQHDPYLLGEQSFSPDAKFIVLLMYYEFVEQAYESLLEGDFEGYDKSTGPFLQNLIKTGLNPHRSHIEDCIYNFIDKCEHLRKNTDAPHFWYHRHTSDKNFWQTPITRILRENGLSDTTYVTNALALVSFYKNGFGVEGMTMSADTTTAFDNCGMETLSVFGDLCIETIGPLIEMKKLYPNMTPRVQAALLLMPYMMHDDLSEAVIDMLGSEGEYAAYIYEASKTRDMYEQLRPDVQMILSDYNAVCLFLAIFQFGMTFGDKNTDHPRFETELETLQALTHQADAVLEEKLVFNKTLEAMLRQVMNANVSLIAQKTGQSEALTKHMWDKAKEEFTTFNAAASGKKLFDQIEFAIPCVMSPAEYAEEPLIFDNDNRAPI